MAPRTAMQVMAEQQELIKKQAKRIEAQDGSIDNLLKVAGDLQGQINRLSRGLQAISQMAGVEAKVASSMGLKLVQADALNPAQPVPEPPTAPPTETTVETKTPEAFADVQAPGLVPGSTQDVAADKTTTNYVPGMEIDSPALKNLVDVTAPIEGTQGQRPLNETKTETDVRVGDPMNPATAFPMRGDFAQQQRTSSVQKTARQIAEEASLRTFASLRLARLRIRTGVEPASGGDTEVAARIEKDASLSISDIERDIGTLETIAKRAATTSEDRNPSLVPKSAARRTTPSLAGTGDGAGQQDIPDEMLFMS
jgi:hypothetical protein